MDFSTTFGPTRLISMASPQPVVAMDATAATAKASPLRLFMTVAPNMEVIEVVLVLWRLFMFFTSSSSVHPEVLVERPQVGRVVDEVIHDFASRVAAIAQ